MVCFRVVVVLCWYFVFVLSFNTSHSVYRADIQKLVYLEVRGKLHKGNAELLTSTDGQT